MTPASTSSLSHTPSITSQSQVNSPPQGGTTKARPQPTNVVTLRDGTTVRVRIEETLAVDDVVRQLCISVKIKEPPGMYCLRDENDELVTNENLRKKVKSKVPLK
jgi:engulfment and cell motility protein 1